MLNVLIENNGITAVVDGEFSPSGDAFLMAFPDGFIVSESADWAWNGTALVRDPALVLARKKAYRLSELAAYRFQKETAGIVINGMTIKTDVDSQAKLTGAWSFSQLNPAVLIDWKAESGWIQIDAATIAAIAGAVATHVQACFSTERIHAEAIAALETSEAVAAYDISTLWSN